MTQTPREAQFLIDQIEQELLDWSRNFNVVQQENKGHFRRADNVVADFREGISLVSSLIDDATQHLYEVQEKSDTVRKQANSTDERAAQTHHHTASVFQSCQRASMEWRAALERSVQLVSQCRAAKVHAESQVASAQYQYSSAEDELKIAHSSYNRCTSSYTTNSKGERIQPNCSSEASRVNSATRNVESALQRLNHCKAMLQDAIRRLNDALNRHRGCEEGVSKTEQALHHADQARDSAGQAIHSAREALQWADEAWHQAAQGSRLAEQMSAQHQTASQHTVQAEHEVADALQEHYAFERTLEEHLSRQWLAREELADAFEALRQINSKEGL
jgi:chromosome segregation ATPase